MPLAYVSIGSNVRREENLRAALDALARRHGRLRLSAVYESRSVGFHGAHFYNLVAGFETDLAPPAIAAELKAIEDAQGRDRSAPRYGDRTLDLDLLLYGEGAYEGQGMRLPRPEVLEHAFVLRPLAEVAGDLFHPGLGLSYAELWSRFDDPAQDLWVVPFETALAD